MRLENGAEDLMGRNRGNEGERWYSRARKRGRANDLSLSDCGRLQHNYQMDTSRHNNSSCWKQWGPREVGPRTLRFRMQRAAVSVVLAGAPCYRALSSKGPQGHGARPCCCRPRCRRCRCSG